MTVIKTCDLLEEGILTSPLTVDDYTMERPYYAHIKDEDGRWIIYKEPLNILIKTAETIKEHPGYLINGKYYILVGHAARIMTEIQTRLEKEGKWEILPES